MRFSLASILFDFFSSSRNFSEITGEASETAVLGGLAYGLASYTPAVPPGKYGCGCC
jgi:hypothetical protein